jgi:ankyrin repeat protein
MALLGAPGVEVDVVNKMGDTPLHGAAWKGMADIVGVLLENGQWQNLSWRW